MRTGGFAQNARTLIKTLSPKPILRWREASYFRKYGEFELRLAKPLCEATRDSIDVGANNGAYVHFMQRYSKRVIAFEPVPWLAEQLRRKFPSHVIVRQMALSNRNESAVLHIPLIDGEPDAGLAALDFPPRDNGNAVEIEVQKRMLDDIYDGDLGFMKIDVEGHEHAVLEGATRTIDRCQPNVLMEIEERHAPGGLGRVRAFFERLGYQGYFVYRASLSEIANFNAQSLQREDNIVGFGCGTARMTYGDYVNNFIFIPGHGVGVTVARIESILKRARGIFASRY